MATSYLIRMTEIHPTREVLVAIFNMSGAARVQFGYGHTSLWLLPNSKRSKQEVIAELQALTDIESFSVTIVSKPVKAEELREVRELINGFGLDTSQISDARLSAFLDAIMDDRKTFYMDFVYHAKPEIPPTILIRPVEEHPYFTPEWLEKPSLPQEDEIDKVYTVDDFEIETFDVELEEDQEKTNPDSK